MDLAVEAEDSLAEDSGEAEGERSKAGLGQMGQGHVTGVGG